MGTQLSIVSNILLLIRPLTNLSAFLLLYMIYICSTRVLFKREVADSKFKILHCWMHFFVLLIAQGLNHWWKLRFDPRWRPVSFWSCQVVAVPDLFLTAVKLSHDKTGAQYLHAARDDSNNLFRLVEIFFSGTKNFSLCGGKLEHSHAVWSWFWKKKKTLWKTLCLLLCFSVQFRTTPMDNTGVPHILEHTVLCGSKKYPCRDPFFKMLNRSLSTFMNAFTGIEHAANNKL